MELRGLYISLSARQWMILVFYTQLSNLAAAVSSVLLVILGQTPFVTVMRYTSTCMLMMTVFVTTCVLIPMGGDPKKLLLTGNGIYHHLLCPVISTVSYIFFEAHSGPILLPSLLTLAYGMIMLYLNSIRRIDGPYPFFRVHEQSVTATILWMIVLFIAITGISAGVRIIAG